MDKGFQKRAQIIRLRGFGGSCDLFRSIPAHNVTFRLEGDGFSSELIHVSSPVFPSSTIYNAAISLTAQANFV